jgi:nitroreductase
MRAPTIIVVVACIKQHPRVPEIEQLISAGAAAQNMLNAAYALDLGAIWRTGDIAYDSTFSKKLGLDANEKIVGFLYLGTAPDGLRTKTPQLNTTDFFKSWP